MEESGRHQWAVVKRKAGLSKRTPAPPRSAGDLARIVDAFIIGLSHSSQVI